MPFWTLSPLDPLIFTPLFLGMLSKLVVNSFKMAAPSVTRIVAGTVPLVTAASETVARPNSVGPRNALCVVS